MAHSRAFRILPQTLVALALVSSGGISGAAPPPPSGVIPASLASAFESGLFALPAPGPGLRTTATQPVWYLPIVAIDFTDQPLTHVGQEFETELFDTTGSTPTGSLYDYYRWVSGNRIRINGKVVAVIHLSHEKNFYANNSSGLSFVSFPRNAYGAVDEALRQADLSVDFSSFDLDHDGYVDMLWVLHSGIPGEAGASGQDLWSITSRMTQWGGGQGYLTNDPVPSAPTQKIRIDRFSIVPELSAIRPNTRSEIGVFCHEFGHALGLPDLYDTSWGAKNYGPGNWSLMSTGSYGGDGVSPEYPTHIGAWPALFLGWTSTIAPAFDTTMVLGPLERGAKLLELWFQGEGNPEHFLVENRQREGFDRNLPGEGLLVYHVDDAAIGARLESNAINRGQWPGLKLVEADGVNDLEIGTSRGDGRDVFPGLAGVTAWDDDTTPNTRSFSAAPTNIALRDIVAAGDDMRFFAQVRARGWLAARNQSRGAYSPAFASGPAARAVQLEDGRLAAVSSEVIGGLPRVVLRERDRDLSWRAPFQISRSPAAALEPTVAALAGSDLAVVWTDNRHGASELYYRARILDVWTSEQRLTDLPGNSRGPSLSADPRGGLHLVWLYTDAGVPKLEFMYFPYTSPFGDPHPITGPADRPDLPVVAARPDGGSWILWPERAGIPTTIRFASFHPDSGIRSSQPLTPQHGETQPSVAALVDRAGVLHAVWPVSGAGAGELHYERREPFQSMAFDTTIERRGDLIQNPSIGVDPDGAVHVAMEVTSGGVPQIRYKLWDPANGWDFASTQVTLPGEGTATRPSVLPSARGVVTVLYTGYPGGQPAWMERRRDLGAGGPTAVAEIVRTGPAILAIAPNPSRAGAPVSIRWLGAALLPGAAIELYDLAGRRVAEMPLLERVAALAGSATRDWPSGVYFARLRGTASVSRLVVVR